MFSGIKYKLNRLLRDFSLVALLVLYSAASLRIDSLHQLFHAEEIVELHSPEQESNPCHKSIYHQQTKKGCEHTSHFTLNTKCPLCEYNGGSEQLICIPQTDQSKIQTASSSLSFQENLLASPIFLLSDRGPPPYA